MVIKIKAFSIYTYIIISLLHNKFCSYFSFDQICCVNSEALYYFLFIKSFSLFFWFSKIMVAIWTLKEMQDKMYVGVLSFWNWDFNWLSNFLAKNLNVSIQWFLKDLLNSISLISSRIWQSRNIISSFLWMNQNVQRWKNHSKQCGMDWCHALKKSFHLMSNFLKNLYVYTDY